MHIYIYLRYDDLLFEVGHFQFQQLRAQFALHVLEGRKEERRGRRGRKEGRKEGRDKGIIKEGRKEGRKK